MKKMTMPRKKVKNIKRYITIAIFLILAIVLYDLSDTILSIKDGVTIYGSGIIIGAIVLYGVFLILEIMIDIDDTE